MPFGRTGRPQRWQTRHGLRYAFEGLRDLQLPVLLTNRERGSKQKSEKAIPRAWVKEARTAGAPAPVSNGSSCT